MPRLAFTREDLTDAMEAGGLLDLDNLTVEDGVPTIAFENLNQAFAFFADLARYAGSLSAYSDYADADGDEGNEVALKATTNSTAWSPVRVRLDGLKLT